MLTSVFSENGPFAVDFFEIGFLFANFVSQNRLGGDERVLTEDPLLAKQVLSQLSYTPTSRAALSSLSLTLATVFLQKTICLPILFHKIGLVGSSGLEPPTSRLSGVRSNHLSYEPMSLYSLCSGSCLASSGFARANLLGAYFQNLRN